MSLSFKNYLLITFFFLALRTHCYSQAELRLGAIYPIRTGSNFFSEAYQSNFGASVEFSFPIHKNLFGQIGYSLFHARVEKPEFVGTIVKTGITHIHASFGYRRPISPKSEVDGKLGLGPAIYRHFQDDDRFYDDGTGLVIGAGYRYRLTTDLGISLGIDYYRDFLNTEVNADDRDFFRNTSIVNPKLGLSIKF